MDGLEWLQRELKHKEDIIDFFKYNNKVEIESWDKIILTEEIKIIKKLIEELKTLSR